MQEVGYAALQIIPSFKDLDKNLEAGTSKAMLAAGSRGGSQFGDAAGKSAGHRFSRMFMTTAKAGLVGMAALGVGAYKLGKDSIALASDLGESVNAVNVTFEKQAKAVRKLGRDSADSLGLSKAEFNGLAVQFSAFATTIGGKGKGVVTTLDDLTTRGADFASVMNLDVNESMALFQSGLAGETEPLRKYGIDLSAAKVEAFALSEGIVKNKDDLTEAAKVQARYELLMKQTSKTQGDFANTSDSLANRQRILSARWDDARAKLGKGLLPIIESATGFILKDGLPAFEKFSDWFTKDGLPAISDFAGDMKPLAESLLPAAGEALGIIADGAKKAAPHVKDMVNGFKDMPDWAKIALVGGGAGLFAGKKLGLGPSLLGGRPGAGLLASAKPIPVFVTNAGFGSRVGPDGNPKGGSRGPGFLGGTVAPLAALYGLDVATHGKVGQIIQDPVGEAKKDLFYPWSSKGEADKSSFMYDATHFTSAAKGAGTLTTQLAALKANTDQAKASTVDLNNRFEAMQLAAGNGKAQVRGLTSGLGDLASQHPTPKVKVIGIPEATSGLRDVKGWLDSIKSKDVFLNVHTIRSDSSGADFMSGGQRHASGGLITGPGGPRDDKIPAWLSNGEYVVNATATSRYRALLDQINAGGRYANGGPVGAGLGRAGALRIELGELRVTGTLQSDLGPVTIRGIARAEAVDVVNRHQRADRVFQRGHERGYGG